MKERVLESQEDAVCVDGLDRLPNERQVVRDVVQEGDCGNDVPPLAVAGLQDRIGPAFHDFEPPPEGRLASSQS